MLWKESGLVSGHGGPDPRLTSREDTEEEDLSARDQRNHLLTKSGRRKAEVGKRWGAVPRGHKEEAASRERLLEKVTVKEPESSRDGKGRDWEQIRP